MDIAKLDTVASSNVINHLKWNFARVGIPETVVSDSSPQYAAQEFMKSAEASVFTRIDSSHRYPQSNGTAERAVQTVKNLLKKSADPYNVLLSYRATPPECRYSPSRLLIFFCFRLMVSPLSCNYFDSAQRGSSVDGTTGMLLRNCLPIILQLYVSNK